MENNNNPTNQPEISYPNNQSPIYSPKVRPLIIISLILILLLVSICSFVLGKYYTGLQEQPLLIQTIKPNKITTPLSVVDLTANWKTYKNTKYNLELKYPQNFDINETQEGFSIQLPSDQISISITSKFDSIYDSIKNYSEEEAQRQSWSFLVSETDYNFGIDNKIIGKKLILRRFLDSGSKYDEEVIYFKNNNNSFSIQNNIDKSLFDQILFSFKFLE